MIQDEQTDEARPGIGRYVPLLVYFLTALTLLLIPLKIVSYGFLPGDDALADAAKAISGKPWPEILVLKDSYKIDNHIGWHALLRRVYLWTNWDADQLVIFSVAALFVLVGWQALPWLRRPEAWLIALIAVPGLDMEFMGRFMLGRPLLISASALMCLLFLWRHCGASPPKLRHLAAMTGLIAIAIALHGVWYLWLLLVVAFLMARQFPWAGAVTASWIAGTIIGSALTGHPITYIVEAIRQVLSVTGNHFTGRTQVSEMLPTADNTFGVAALGALFLLRYLGGLKSWPWLASPVFWLVGIGWVLGWISARFWTDWGIPALLVLVAIEIQPFLERQISFHSLQRLGLTSGLAVTLYLVATADVQTRWTGNLNTFYLQQDDPALAGWLPDKGGILYAADMSVFYQTFFKNPKADWRYMVGFESVFMPDDDFKIFEQIIWNAGDPNSYLPWIKKMKPADRLILLRGSGRPTLGELEWNYAANNLWIGRLPRAKSGIHAGKK